VPVPPDDQQLPEQERGVRPARALPYTLHADGKVADGMLGITFRNAGTAAAVFHARSAATGEEPRTYTVEPGMFITGSWAATGGHDVSVHGPNGFHRSFAADAQAPAVAITTEYDTRAEKITLVIRNLGAARVQLTVRDGYSGRRTVVSLRSGQTATRSWSVEKTHGWYNLAVACGEKAKLRQRYAGHLENGRDSISDPAMGGLTRM
jgi:phospholipase C